MNLQLSHLPNREKKTREFGLTMVMDKGISLRQAEDMIDGGAEYIDLVKLGFGTSVFSSNVKEKVKLYQNAGIKVYVGGTLFEACWVRGELDKYRKYIDGLGIDTVEVSDGSMSVDHGEKCKVITDFAKNYRVLSEVGSKEEGILISPTRWIKMMQNELAAGSWKVIAEARESGTVGIYRPSGQAHVVLINKILSKVNGNDIIWEAPKKAQQVYFIKSLGHNVNLGNIAENEVIPLECLRSGLRGDTFFDYLPEDIVSKSKA